MAPNRPEFGAQMELVMAAAAPHADGDPITVRFGEHPTCRIRDMTKIEFDEETRTHRLRFDLASLAARGT